MGRAAARRGLQSPGPRGGGRVLPAHPPHFPPFKAVSAAVAVITHHSASFGEGGGRGLQTEQLFQHQGGTAALSAKQASFWPPSAAGQAGVFRTLPGTLPPGALWRALASGRVVTTGTWAQWPVPPYLTLGHKDSPALPPANSWGPRVRGQSPRLARLKGCT